MMRTLLRTKKKRPNQEKTRTDVSKIACFTENTSIFRPKTCGSGHLKASLDQRSGMSKYIFLIKGPNSGTHQDIGSVSDHRFQKVMHF